MNESLFALWYQMQMLEAVIYFMLMKQESWLDWLDPNDISLADSLFIV